MALPLRGTEAFDRYASGLDPRLPFPTAHFWFTVRREGEQVEPAELDRMLVASSDILGALDLLDWRQEFDPTGVATEGYIEWLCTKRFAFMGAAIEEIASLPRLTRTTWAAANASGAFTCHVNDGEGNDEVAFAIELDELDEPKPIDRCEACGSDRGDGYCQECPDDPDRPKEG